MHSYNTEVKRLLNFLFFLFTFFFIENVYSQPLSAVLPKNNFVTDNPHIHFVWNKKSNAVYYDLQLASDSLFTLNVKNHFAIVNSYLDDTLSLNRVYWWRVRSFNGSVYSSWIAPAKLYILNPTNFSGLQIWLRSDTGLVLDGSLVAQWNDISGNGNNAFQTTGWRRPALYVSDTLLNYYPSVKFDGVSTRLETMYMQPNAYSIFIIYSHRNGNVGSFYSTDMPGYPLQRNTGIWPNSNNANYGLGEDSLNLRNLYVDVHDFLNDNYSTFLNGIYVGGFNIALSKTTGNFYIGYANNELLNGNIAEFLIYDTPLSDSIRGLVEKYLMNRYAHPVNLGSDILLNNFCNTVLDAGPKFTHYHWSTGATTQTINASNGLYSVTVTDIFGYYSSDTIFVNKPIIAMHDTSSCQNTNIIVSAGLGSNYSYKWSIGDTTETITINIPGIYSVTVTDKQGCSASDDFVLSVFASQISLGPDKSICDSTYINLVSGASEVTNYLWSDGTTNTKLLVNKAGTYSLTVSNAVGCIAADTINVTIKGPPPVPNFFADSVCIKNSTHFFDASSIPLPFSITGWNWNFGDNSVSSSQNPIHTYLSSGIYNVELTNTTNVGCTKKISKQVKVYSLPKVNYSPVNGCTGVQIQFTDKTINQVGTITSWHWCFDDTNSGLLNTSLLKNPTHTFDSAGTYHVTLVVGTEAQCIDSILKTITIRQAPKVNFSFTSVCIGNPTYFIDTTPTYPWSGIDNWQWTFGDGDSANISNPVHTFNSAGIYNVILTIHSLNGCITSTTKAVKVHAIPISDFNYSDLCKGISHQFIDNSTVQDDTIAVWNWSFGNHGISSVKNPFFAFPDTGLYTVSLSVFSNTGCTDFTSRTVQVHSTPLSDFTFTPEFGTAPLNITFTNQSLNSANFVWIFGDSTPNSTLINPTHLYNNNGIYNVSLIATNIYGCMDTISKEIKVIPSSVDIAVNKVDASKSMNYLSLASDLVNYGTRKIDTVFLDAYVDGGYRYRETYIGTIDPGSLLHYLFNSQLLLVNNQTPKYACIIASLPTSDNETKLSNNEMCYTFNNEFVMDIFPNPSDKVLNIYYILPFNDPVEIFIYDSKGSKLKTIFSGQGSKGLNRIVFDLLDLSNGLYAIKINFRDKSIVKKFVKL